MSINKKILLIEDNSDEVQLTLRAFHKNNSGIEIIVKNNGEEALDFLSGEGGLTATKSGFVFPALILLDLKLPKLDGLDVLKILKNDNRTKMIPVVVLTSSKEKSDMISSYQLGCNSYVSKPVDFAKFTDLIKQLSKYWLLLNEAPDQLP